MSVTRSITAPYGFTGKTSLLDARKQNGSWLNDKGSGGGSYPSNFMPLFPGPAILSVTINSGAFYLYTNRGTSSSLSYSIGIWISLKVPCLHAGISSSITWMPYQQGVLFNKWTKASYSGGSTTYYWDSKETTIPSNYGTAWFTIPEGAVPDDTKPCQIIISQWMDSMTDHPTEMIDDVYVSGEPYPTSSSMFGAQNTFPSKMSYTMSIYH